MAVVDIANRTITLKIVYYGCALGGKTTNLLTLHRLTDPENAHGLVSIATKDDRTLFFDLLPMDLGQIGGMLVKVKLYTVPGQVHYELTRRQVLRGTDGVVLVADSHPDADQKNRWSLENLIFNLKANGLDPEGTPIVMQWNKRDLPEARPVEELSRQLNRRGHAEFEAVATTGRGVVESFGSCLKQSIVYAYQKSGRSAIPAETISETVDRALEHARQTDSETTPPAEQTFDHRFDMDSYRDELGKDKRIVDESTLLSEAVYSNMMLAEKLDDYKATKTLSERRNQMMGALGKIAPSLADPSGGALPTGLMAQMLEGARRKRGSILLFRGDEPAMEEREVVPGGSDPLNVSIEGVGSVARQKSHETELRVIEDLAAEVYFGSVPPEAEGLAAALFAPLRCDGMAFGSLVVYSDLAGVGFDSTEREYWRTAATFIGLSLHWRALRAKLTQAIA